MCVTVLKTIGFQNQLGQYGNVFRILTLPRNFCKTDFWNVAINCGDVNCIRRCATYNFESNNLLIEKLYRINLEVSDRCTVGTCVGTVFGCGWYYVQCFDVFRRTLIIFYTLNTSCVSRYHDIIKSLRKHIRIYDMMDSSRDISLIEPG